MTHDNLHLILGPPGTGKTTFLLDVVSAELEAGTRPNQIAVLTFTKKAANEARERAAKKFGFRPEDLFWFRTIHSLVFSQMGYSKNQVIGKKDLDELGKKIGVEFAGVGSFDDGITSQLEEGDKLVFLENLARVTGLGLQKIWEQSDHGLEWSKLELFARTYRMYKQQSGKIDFTDMLEEFIQRKVVPPVEVMIVDEGQDLSAMQWKIISLVAKRCRVVYVAGDDDQAIYRWAGADVDQFVRIQGTERVLEQSYRISRAIHEVANVLSSRLKLRRSKIFNSRDFDGAVEWIYEPHEIDMSKDTWLLLARHTYQLDEYERLCQENGWTYETKGKSFSDSPTIRAIMSWENLRRGNAITVASAIEVAKRTSFFPRASTLKLAKREPREFIGLDDMRILGLSCEDIWHETMDKIPWREKEFYIRARQQGEKLTAEPRIKISTIHGAKGGQADHVVLATDISETCHTSMLQNPDDETRVFYVGVTRGKSNLYLLYPRSQYYYPFEGEIQ